MKPVHKFGFVAIAGPPNAGKSTLINRIIGQKISIISRRPQTTRHRILGIKTLDHAQLAFIDTPGLHFGEKKNLNRVINRTAIDSLTDVDLIVFMIDHRGWNPANTHAFKTVTDRNAPVLLVINKIDMLKDKSRLLPLIKESSELHDFVEIIPLSALQLGDPNSLLDTLVRHLPQGPPGFPADQVSSRGDKFFASELVREQMFLMLGRELPYESAVEVVRFDRNDPDFCYADMTLWVEKQSQKSIVIGSGGQQLRAIGENARKAMEKAFDTRVRLNLWVKVRKGWADNNTMLKSLGYTET